MKKSFISLKKGVGGYIINPIALEWVNRPTQELSSSIYLYTY